MTTDDFRGTGEGVLSNEEIITKHYLIFGNSGQNNMFIL